ncbi:MAG: type II CRISPR RNA-guided endonuclease Cas9, partial [Alphaproteobacteria bacterium]
MIDLDENGNAIGLRDAGVRIFSSSELAGRDPKTKTSLAKGRREARAARRRRDRYLRRRTRLMETLVNAGLMPEDEDERKALASLDPYEIRARALKERVPLHHLGRAIFHLNQRRGFKSNRKTDAGEGDDTGKIRSGVERLREAMLAAGAQTLGEFLYHRQRQGEWVRARPAKLNGEGGKATEGYEIYPDRGMILEEFSALWAAQARHYPEILTDRWRSEIERILFFQRPLKPVTGGRCPFEPSEERLAKAHPLSQRLRIFQELNNLAVEVPGKPARFLSRAERDRLADKLLAQKDLEFDQIRKLLDLPPDAQFNLERGERDKLKGDETAAVLSSKKAWGPGWRLLSFADQCAIVERLDTVEDESALVAWLKEHWGLDEDRACAVARARLPAGHGRLGPTAGGKILAALEAEVIPYSDAVAKAGYHHSDFRTGEIFDRLPYYGVILDRYTAFGTGNPDDPDELRLGKIANPTVHIGLNQLRRLVNRIIDEHGHPDEIILEVGRDLRQNDKQRKADLAFQKENRERNDRYRQIFEELGIADTGENRAKMRLWEELNLKDPNDRRCPFCGGQISIHQLFSPEVEIE